MDKLGYVKVAAASPSKIGIGEPFENAARIYDYLVRANKKRSEIIVFPELCITGYTCGDLFFQKTLLDNAEAALEKILDMTTLFAGVLVAVGMPVRHNNQLYNCAVLLNNGKILAVIPKTYIPNHNEFYEKRYFASGAGVKQEEIELLSMKVPFGTNILVKLQNSYHQDCIIGVEICEDAWAPITPGVKHCLHGADIILNLSASNEVASKRAYRRSLISSLSAQEISGYVYASASMAESTSDTVYSGHKLICENGHILAESEFNVDDDIIVSDIDIERLRADRMKNTNYSTAMSGEPYTICTITKWRDSEIDENNRRVSLTPFVPPLYDKEELSQRAKEILDIQATGLAQHLKKTGIRTAVIGISGGLDSTLALLTTVKAFNMLSWPLSGIIGVTMPGFGTTALTKSNATELMECLGVTSMTIDIKEVCKKHLQDIGHPLDVYDITYENAQARERTQILMDLANKYSGLVIGTGDLSELALGWCTYNGDHMSMYAVNSGIPKTLVRHLVQYFAEVCNEKNRRLNTENLLAAIGEKQTQNMRIEDCLKSILDTPISPELLPPNADGTIAQKTEDSIGNYTIHDFVLYYMLRFGFGPAKIFNLFMNSVKGTKWENVSSKEVLKNMKIFYRRFFNQQFKRNCVPDGIKVGSVSLSPRADWRMPSDSSADDLWQVEIEQIESALKHKV